MVNISVGVSVKSISIFNLNYAIVIFPRLQIDKIYFKLMKTIINTENTKLRKQTTFLEFIKVLTNLSALLTLPQTTLIVFENFLLT